MVHAPWPGTLSPGTDMRLSSNRGAAAPRYHCLALSAFRPPSRSGEDASCRLLQPTHNTSTRRPSDSQAGQLSPTMTSAAFYRFASAEPAFRRAQPQVEACLTARFRLRPNPSQHPFGCRPKFMDRLAAAFSTARQGEGRPLAFPFALPRELWFAETAEALGPLPLPSRQSEQLRRPGTPSIVRCCPGVLSHGPSQPATILSALPPTRRLPTRFRSSSLSREMLDPKADGFSPRRLWAKRRLTTSAIETIREHDHVIVRTPLTTRAVARTCSSARARPFGTTARWRVATPLSRQANRDFTAQGQARSSPALPATIARGGALPQPVRLGHLLSRRRGAGAWRTHATEHRSMPVTTPPTARRFHGVPYKGRLSRLPAKGAAIRRTRGAFHRQTPP